MRKYLPDAVCGIDRRYADPLIQMICKQLVELDAEQTPLGKQRSVLLDGREEVRDGSCLRYDYSLAEQRPALGSAYIEHIA